MQEMAFQKLWTFLEANYWKQIQYYWQYVNHYLLLLFNNI